MTIAITRPGQGEAFVAGPVRFRVLDDGVAVGSRSGVIELTLPPAWGGPPQHVHREHDETFYMLSGSVQFTSGTTSVHAPAGSLITAPIGEPHTFGNPDADTGARLLCTVTPERYLGYFRELQHLRPGPDGTLDPEEILALMRRYATNPYLTPN